MPSIGIISPTTRIWGRIKTECSVDERRKHPMLEPTKEELLARIAELEKQSVAKKSEKLEIKVGEKGGVSVYGLGRFPSLCITSSG